MQANAAAVCKRNTYMLLTWAITNCRMRCLWVQEDKTWHTLKRSVVVATHADLTLQKIEKGQKNVAQYVDARRRNPKLAALLGGPFFCSTPPPKDAAETCATQTF